MAFIEARFHSPALDRPMTLTAHLPDRGAGPFPVLYLLHGWGGDHRDWSRGARLAPRLRDLPLAVVMPDGGNGFWIDHREGEAWGAYLVDDVLGFVERVFPVARGRAGRAIGGLSMGGYGALRIAFARPDLFTSVNVHAGGRAPWPALDPALARRVFGPAPDGGDGDVLALAARLVAERAPLPRLRLDGGADDPWLPAARGLHRGLAGLGIPHEYAETPGGHDWDCWDAQLPAALAFHAHALALA